MNSRPHCKNLVLDAGPLLSLSPLRGLAETYLTVPQVLAELKDNRAREHFERLGLNAGVRIEIRNPDPRSLSKVIEFSKKTGDYSVLSHADLCILALTHTLNEQATKEAPEDLTNESRTDNAPTDAIADTMENLSLATDDALSKTEAQTESAGAQESPSPPTNTTPAPVTTSDDPQPIYDDPSDSDDGEGEWITPSNVSLHKSRALDLLPTDKLDKKSASNEVIHVGCMTADFAMQNVLLQMGLSLVSTEGKRIEKVKSWVLRCHACFKICKDNTKKFCPSCGNPSLLRASVTISSPTATDSTPEMQVHLKPNFQYKIRGTKYSIPAPKPGNAKTGTGEGLILREDQIEYQRALKRAEGKRAKEEQRMMKGIFDQGTEGGVQGSWMDPDWIPEIISVGAGGKGRTTRGGGSGDMPRIGYGRKNPNERRAKK